MQDQITRVLEQKGRAHPALCRTLLFFLCFLILIPATYARPFKVSPLHPRVYVRHDAAKFGKGITVAQLRQRGGVRFFSEWKRPVKCEGPASAVEVAARYLEEGNSADLNAVAEFLQTHTYSYEKDDVGGFLAGAEMATAYDWIQAGLNRDQKNAILRNLVTTAEASRNFLLNGEPDINHNYTYMALWTMVVAGLVLRGEGEEFDLKSGQYLALAEEWLEKPGKILDTWKARRGAWGEGSHYTFHETLRNLVMLLHAFRSATDRDYFPLIEKHYGNFLQQAGLFLVASTRPDLTLERIGDTGSSRALPLITVPVTVEALASALSSPVEASRLRSFASAVRLAYGEKAVHPAFGWGMRVFAAPQAPKAPSYRDYPVFLRLGAGTDERIVWRSGWEEDSTMITVLAGDHYTDHQHLDKGHFLIYHRGGLAVDGGAYDDLYKPHAHWNNYSSRTLAHNCLLLYDPDEITPPGYANDGGQKILRGLQHHADWLTYVDHARKEHLDTGTVLAYDADEKRKYAYMKVDLSQAYPAQASRYERQFLFLPEWRLFLVHDRVQTLRSKIQPRWLLHFQDQPALDGTSVSVGVSSPPRPGLIEVKREGQFQQGNHFARYDGQLRLLPLLPINAELHVVGGAGFEFYNPFNSTNYPPSNPRTLAPPREPGAWRVELSPKETSNEIGYLNVLQAGGPEEESWFSPVCLVKDQAGKMEGAHLKSPRGQLLVLTATSGQFDPVRFPITYSLESDVPVRHLLTGLLGMARAGLEINGKKLGSVTVSPQGVLDFSDRGGGQRTIVLKPLKEEGVKLEHQLPAGHPRRQ